MCVRVCVYFCVCVSVCGCVYMEMHRDTQNIYIKQYLSHSVTKPLLEYQQVKALGIKNLCLYRHTL